MACKNPRRFNRATTCLSTLCQLALRLRIWIPLSFSPYGALEGKNSLQEAHVSAKLTLRGRCWPGVHSPKRSENLPSQHLLHPPCFFHPFQGCLETRGVGWESRRGSEATMCMQKVLFPAGTGDYSSTLCGPQSTGRVLFSACPSL